jgi:hypothetical protein
MKKFYRERHETHENKTRLEAIPVRFHFAATLNKIDVDFNFIEMYKTKEQFNFIK